MVVARVRGRYFWYRFLRVSIHAVAIRHRHTLFVLQYYLGRDKRVFCIRNNAYLLTGLHTFFKENKVLAREKSYAAITHHLRAHNSAYLLPLVRILEQHRLIS